MSDTAALLVQQDLDRVSNSLISVANAISSRPLPYDTGESVIVGAVVISIAMVIGFVAHAYIGRKK